MDSNNDKHPEGCRCRMCMMEKCGEKMCGHGGCCRRGMMHCILRCVLALIILSIVFNAGVKIGELKSMLENGYTHHSYYSQQQYDPSYSYGSNYGMMGNGYNSSY